MAFVLVNNGDVPDEDYFNDDLMRQAVAKCTSGTRPSPPVEGQLIYETDTDRFLGYNLATTTWEQIHTLGGWTNYTPTFTAASGGGGVGSGATQHGAYKLHGKTCVTEGVLVFGTGASGGSGGFQISLPFTAATRTSASWLGSAYYRDVSATSVGHFIGFCIVASAGTLMEFYAASGNQQVQAGAPFTWVSTDFLRWSVTYEIA